MRRLTRLCLAGTALLATPFVAPIVLNAADKGDAAPTGKTNTYELLKLFGDVFDRVRSDYVEETKDSNLIEAAINGMLTSLDPHSSYMNEKQFKEMQVQTKGEFGGLGIEVTMENGLVKVVSPIDETPAAKAGVKPGDYISYIDDEPVMGTTLSDAVEKMRGKVGTAVKLTILREDAPEPLELTITRDVIKIRASRGHIEGDIIYVRINSFTETTTESMRAEIERQKKEIGAGKIKGLVLDLRNNPGGLLEQAISVSDAFLKQGEVVSTRERDPSKTKRYTAHAGDEIIDDSIPMVVLINNGSASASEIVAGALQDQKRALILGTKSFGKGSVQTVIPLPDHGAMRLTTSRYYTPSGHSIQAKGIVPDIEVQQAKIEPIKSEKMRLEADLRKRLQNLDDEKEKKKNPKAADEPKADDKLSNDGKTEKDDRDKPLKEEPKAEPKDDKKGDKKDDKKDDKAKKPLRPGEIDAQEDFQLQRALDLLRAIHVYSKVTPEN
jgi:carboxyl-terminal processing protease